MVTRATERDTAFGMWLKSHLNQLGRGGSSRLAQELHRSLQTISEYKSGAKTPTARGLGQIAVFFNADPAELAEMTGRDPIDVAQACVEYSWPLAVTSQGFVTEAYSQLNVARALRDCGQTLFSLELLDRWIGYIRQRLRIEQGNAQQNRTRINELQALLLRSLNDRTRCMNDVIPKDELVDRTLPDYRQAVRFAEEIGETREKARAYSLRSNAYYVASRSAEASIWVDKYLATIGDLPPHVPGVRMSLLVPAFLGDPIQFRKAEKSSLALLDSGRIIPPQEQASLFEAIGYGRVLLGLPDAGIWLDQAEEEFDRGRTSGDVLPLRHLQIIRSRLVSETMANKPDVDRIEELLRLGTSIAQEYGYKRHGDQLRRIGKKLDIVIG